MLFVFNAGDHGKATLETIQKLILRGKRVEAIELAFESNNFALALLIASHCGPETYQQTVQQYADKAFRNGSPLHTIGILFSGQQLDSSLPTLNSKELLGSWRHHLAAIMSNRTGGWDRSVFTLGTKLQQLGNTHAAHVCFMVCGIQIMSPIFPETYMSLLGCDHLLPENVSLMTKEGIEAYGRTEAYEWAKRRGNPSALIKPLQPFKLQYAMLLADLGLVDLAKKYLENILMMCELDRDDRRFSNHTSSARLTLPEMCESADAFQAALGSFEQRLFQTVPDGSAEKRLTFEEPKQQQQQEAPPHFQSPMSQMSREDEIPGISTALSNESDMSFLTAATSHIPDALGASSAVQPKKKDRINAKASANKLARVKRKEKNKLSEMPIKEKPSTDGLAAAAMKPSPMSDPIPAPPMSAPPGQLKSPPMAKSDMSTPKDSGKQGSKPSGLKKPAEAPKSAPAAVQSKFS